MSWSLRTLAPLYLKLTGFGGLSQGTTVCDPTPNSYVKTGIPQNKSDPFKKKKKNGKMKFQFELWRKLSPRTFLRPVVTL